MTISLIFSFNRELLSFLIVNKEVFYKDKVFIKYIRVVPEDKELIEQIKAQEAKQSKFLPAQFRVNHKIFELSPQEIKEYEECKTDEDVAALIKRDASSRGCLLVSEVKK